MKADEWNLGKLAMEFTREVLGWQDAVFDGYSPPRGIWKEQPSVEVKREYFGFNFGEHGDVMRLIEVWCDEREDVGLVLHRTRHREFVATIQDESVIPARVIAESSLCESSSEALLSACLEAHRKLRGVT
jgi:hypothetical protein